MTHFKTTWSFLLMNTVIKLCCICFSLISLLLSCNLKAEYKVEDIRDPAGKISLSYSGDYYMSGGLARFVVRNLNDKSAVGHICCHSREEFREAYFLRDGSGVDLVLQIRYQYGASGTLVVWSKNGEKVSQEIEFKSASAPKIYVSPSKTYFAIVTNDKALVFNSRLELSFSAFFDFSAFFNFGEVRTFTLADDGASFIVYADKAFLKFDKSGHSEKIVDCPINPNAHIVATSFLGESDHFYIVNFGRGCDINGEEVRTFDMENISGYLEDVYAAGNNVYFIFSKKFSIYSVDLNDEKLNFDLEKYYWPKYGPDPSVKPHFSRGGNALDFDKNEFYLSGYGATGLIFKVSFYP